MYLRPRLLERLRRGEIPTRATLPPGLRQHELVDWTWWQMGRRMVVTGHDIGGRLHVSGCVYRVGGEFDWAWAQNGFYWLGDGAAR